MDMLIWIGTAITVLGLIGILYSLVQVMRLRRAGLDDAIMREKLQKVMPLNLGALAFSVIGLMLVILGISLG